MFPLSSICPADLAVEQLSTSAIGTTLGPGVLNAALAHAAHRGQSRHRKLPLSFTLLFCVLIHLYRDEALPAIFARPIGRWAGAARQRVSASALCQGRYRLDVGPLVTLFHLVCRPVATADMTGPFSVDGACWPSTAPNSTRPIRTPMLRSLVATMPGVGRAPECLAAGRHSRSGSAVPVVGAGVPTWIAALRSPRCFRPWLQWVDRARRLPSAMHVRTNRNRVNNARGIAAVAATLASEPDRPN